jgi:hypothetical protein
MDNTPFGIVLLVYLLFIWSLIWKGLALWRAAKQSQRNWFVVLILPFNTAGILEIVYLFRFSKKRMTLNEIKTWFKDTFYTKSK